MPRSNLVNAVDVALAADVAGADPTIQVTTPELLPPVPFYLVIDPFGDSSREYLRATSLAVDVLSVERDLDGSQSTTHSAGDIVRISYVAQHLSDLWSGIEGIPPQTYLHADLTDVTADQHHAKYTDAEAIAAVGPHTPPQTYLHVDLTDVAPDQHHAKYTDAEAVAAVGPHTPPFSALHADLTDVSADQHHTRYTDAEAVAAIGTPWTAYLPLTGGTITGVLNINFQASGGLVVGGQIPLKFGTAGFAFELGDSASDFWYPIRLNRVGVSWEVGMSGPDLVILGSGGNSLRLRDSGSATFSQPIEIATGYSFAANVVRASWIGMTPPGDPQVGQIWFDTS